MARIPLEITPEQASEAYDRLGSINQAALELGVSRQTVRRRLRGESDVGGGEQQVGDDVTDFIEIVQDRGAVSVIELCTELDCPPSRIHNLIEYHQSKGVDVCQSGEQVIHSQVPLEGKQPEALGGREIVFAVTSDLHFGSNAAQISALHEFCGECKKRGVKHILVPGDVFAGRKVYQGQEHDLYAQTATMQESSANRNLPGGFDWYLLGGNHDYKFFSLDGHNAIAALASMREDCHYLGFDEAVVPILPGVDAILWHPSGGVPYAISYRLQKATEQVAYDEIMQVVREKKARPSVRFFFAGHLHIQLQILMGSILACQCGCFEGTTNYLRRKKLVPAVGGYIVEACLDRKGNFKNYDTKFYLYDEIEDDWRNYNHDPEEMASVTAPIMQG